MRACLRKEEEVFMITKYLHVSRNQDLLTEP